jgi:uncharacterized repeat protein (TIGR02543 family)
MVFAMIGVYADTPDSEGEITSLEVVESESEGEITSLGVNSYDLSTGNVAIVFTGTDKYSVTQGGTTVDNQTSGVDSVYVNANGAIPANRTISVDGNGNTINSPVQIEIEDITAAGAGSRINLTNGANVNLVAKGTNSLTSSNNAAIAVPEGTSILINGSGSLNAQAEAKSGNSAAGIGGVNGNYGHAGTIHINGDVTVTAVGTPLGAGIGGGGNANAYGGNGGNITIDGNAHVIASSPGQNMDCGAGIGGGSGGRSGIIVIGGNAVVRAQSNGGSGGNAGAAIGAGGGALQADITIKGNAIVYAYAAEWGSSSAIGGGDTRRTGSGIGAGQNISINILGNAQVYAYKQTQIGAAIGTGAVGEKSSSRLANMTINIGNSDGSGSPNVVAIGGTGYDGYSSPAIGYATTNNIDMIMTGALNITVNAGKVIAYNQSTFDTAAIGATKGAPPTVNIKFGDEVSVVTVLNNNVGASTANTTSVRPVTVDGANTPLYYFPVRTMKKADDTPLTLVETDLYQGLVIAGTPLRTDDYSWGLEWIESAFANDSKGIFNSDTSLMSFLNNGNQDVRGMIGYWLTSDTYSLLGSKTDYLDEERYGDILSSANLTAPLPLKLGVGVTYKVTYYSIGHTAGSVPAYTTHNTGTNATILNNGTLAREGYTFSGWSTDSEATTVHYAPGEIINAISANVDLYAVWTEDTVVNPPVVNPPVVNPPVVDPPVVTPPVVPTVVENTDVDDTPEVTTTDVISGEGTQNPETPINDDTVIGDSDTANSPTTVNIFGNDVPLFGQSGVAAWAFLNLLLAIVGVIVTAFVLIKAAIKRRKDEDEYAGAEFYAEDEQEKPRTRKLFLILGIVAAVVGIVLFIITEDLSAPMVLMDAWTIVQAVICAAAIVFGKFASRKQKDRLAERA